VLSKLGVKLGSVEIQPEGIWTTEHAWADPRPMIHERGLIARVEQDDSFWATILRKVGGPPVDEEHIGEIKALCENGSWTREHWDLLRKTQGNESLEQAIGLIEAREDWNKLLGVLVHAVADMDRAADLFMRKRMDFGELNWARERIVEHLEKTAPEKAAELFFQDAEEYLEPGTSRAWRDTAKALTAAHDLLLEADLARVWAERLRAFRQKHGGCKVELTRFGGHPETRKSARGVFDGEAEAKSLYR
jgi:hypothetical protein